MYYFYMGSVLLPVNPEKFTWKVKNANKTMTLINEGEVNFLRDAGLTELEFDVLIPAVQHSFAKYDGGFKSPSYFTDYFEKLKTDKEPFQFIVSRQMPDGKLLFDNNLTVSMESYTVKEEAKNGFDLTVSIKLKQYKPYGTKIVKVEANNATVVKQREQTNSPAPKKDTTYESKAHDTLYNIARKYYGDDSMWEVLYYVNANVIKSPNELGTGRVLTLPKADIADMKAQLPKKSRVKITPIDNTTNSVILGVVEANSIDYFSGDYITSTTASNSVINTLVGLGSNMVLRVERKDPKNKNKIQVTVSHDGQLMYQNYIPDTKNSIELQFTPNTPTYELRVSAIQMSK